MASQDTSFRFGSMTLQEQHGDTILPARCEGKQRLVFAVLRHLICSGESG